MPSRTSSRLRWTRTWSLRRIVLAFTLSAACAGVLPPAGHAATIKKTVDCGKPKATIAKAIVASGTALVITVKGTCNENVVIDRDGVTLIADPAGGAIVGLDPAVDTVRIESGRDIVIDGLVVSGGRHGIIGLNGAVFTVQNAIVQSNVQNGIVAIFNSTVTVNNDNIHDNGTGSPQPGDPQLGFFGVLVVDSSTGVVLNSLIHDNGGTGVSASRGSSLRVGRGPSAVDGPNTIASNGSSGISVFHSSTGVIWGNTIQGNAANGVYVEGGTATIVKNLLDSNGGDGIAVTNSGGARIGFDDTTTVQRRTDCLLLSGQQCTNKITNNGSDGIEVSNGANANIYGTLLQGNQGYGLDVSTATARSAGDNTILGNGLSGVGVLRSQFLQGTFGTLSPSRDYVRNNGTLKIDEPSSGYGVLVFGAATANMNNFDVSNNRRDGVGVFFSAAASLRSETLAGKSVINGNGTPPTAGDNGVGTGPAPFSSIGSGVNVFGNAFAEIRGIDITNNLTNGVSISTGSSATVRAHILDDGLGDTIKTTISGNKTNGISVFNGSSVNVQNNTTISSNGTPGSGAGLPTGSGLNVSNNSGANVVDSTITANALHGINVFGNSTVQIGASPTLFPPVGSFVLGSSVTGNGRDGITASTNSVVNFIAATGGVNGDQVATSVTGNGRNGLGCFSMSRVVGNTALVGPAVTGNATGSGLGGADFSGNVLVQITVSTPAPGTANVLGPTVMTSTNFTNGNCL